MSSPLISVMMPCYNARESLPWALGSLLVQSFDDWELVLVDDGSTDCPEEVVEQAADPRIRLIRLPENQGRGHARQVALENARGEFLAMLDADDWMYPERLKMELDVLRTDPFVAIVSAGMALTDTQNEIIGVRLKGDGQIRGPHQVFTVPMAHAPSMLRRRVTHEARFDEAMRRGEDADFMSRVIQGQYSITLPNLLYVYQESETISGQKAVEDHRYWRRAHRKQLRATPFRASRAIVESWIKEIAYRGADRFNLNHLVTRGKQEPPTAAEIEAFAEARRVVGDTVARVFGGGERSGCVE